MKTIITIMLLAITMAVQSQAVSTWEVYRIDVVDVQTLKLKQTSPGDALISFDETFENIYITYNDNRTERYQSYLEETKNNQELMSFTGRINYKGEIGLWMLIFSKQTRKQSFIMAFDGNEMIQFHLIQY